MLAAALEEAPEVAELPHWQQRARDRLPHPAIGDRLDSVKAMPLSQSLLDAYKWAEKVGRSAQRYLALTDRYYLLLVLCGRIDMMQHGPKGSRWLYERCREVEAEPDGHIDLWARDHYKSSLITFGGIIQEVLRDPEITTGIFSFNRPIAKGFLSQIKREFETNEDLRILFDDVLWWEPKKEAPRWSLDNGIVVKRRRNPKESTIEAWGLVDGQPTSKHFELRVYDDVWTRDNVTTPEQIKKTQEARELSDSLGTRGGRQWNIGTRYSYADGYGVQIERGTVIPRIYPATEDGRENGVPVFLTEPEWAKKKRDQPSQIASQYLQDPLQGAGRMFEAKWLSP
jgi:hypothetical protein